MAPPGVALLTVLTTFVTHHVTGLDEVTKDYILGLHNKYRKGEGASNMKKLVWDQALQSKAAGWAAGCSYKHKEGRGENLAWNSKTEKPETELIDIAMKNFFDEKLRYSYGQRSCGTSAACHYTQLVWAKSQRVGCASRICTPLANAYSKAWYLVCFYDPKGNPGDEEPFEKGPACSGCSGGTCEDGLCVGGTTAQACVDNDHSCRDWAAKDECNHNPGYMLTNCAKSCGTCEAETDSQACVDNNHSCRDWATRNECNHNPGYMLTNCAKSCGTC